MSSVVISGDTSGAITVAAPAVSGTNTLTLQAGTATNSMNTRGTAVASTSGTSIDFTGLPDWVKRITVMFQGVSTSGTSLPIIQLGTGSTTYTASGYVGSTTDASTAVATVNHNTGVPLQASGGAATVMQGAVVISNLTGNVWASFGVIGRSNTTNTSMTGGTISLAAALTAVRITTVNGTDTFDAGTINILYEG